MNLDARTVQQQQSLVIFAEHVQEATLVLASVVWPQAAPANNSEAAVTAQDVCASTGAGASEHMNTAEQARNTPSSRIAVFAAPCDAQCSTCDPARSGFETARSMAASLMTCSPPDDAAPMCAPHEDSTGAVARIAAKMQRVSKRAQAQRAKEAVKGVSTHLQQLQTLRAYVPA